MGSMRPTIINARLLEAGITHKEIARRAGVSEAAVSLATIPDYKCVQGGSIWRARLVICDILKAKMEDLWEFRDRKLLSSPVGK